MKKEYNFSKSWLRSSYADKVAARQSSISIPYLKYLETVGCMRVILFIKSNYTSSRCKIKSFCFCISLKPAQVKNNGKFNHLIYFQWPMGNKLMDTVHFVVNRCLSQTHNWHYLACLWSVSRQRWVDIDLMDRDWTTISLLKT